MWPLSVRASETVETVAALVTCVGASNFGGARSRAAVIGRIGIGDVFGQHPLALLRPFQPGAQHGQDRNIGDRHGGPP